MTWPVEFGACLAAVLGLRPDELPESDGEPGTFWRQWLARRNLGLAPIASPDTFSWAASGSARSSASGSG